MNFKYLNQMIQYIENNLTNEIEYKKLAKIVGVSEYNLQRIFSFLEQIKKFNIDIDIMLEAKAKDEAIFRLVRQLKFKTNYKFIDDTSFIV